jgi:uncharacterized protein
MSLDKPSKPEDEFFAAEEVEAKRKLAFRQAQVLAEKQQEELKKLHYMKCPKCGFDLHALTEGQVHLDGCFNCHGVWLDAGELARLKVEAVKQQRKTPLINSILDLFKKD